MDKINVTDNSDGLGRSWGMDEMMYLIVLMLTDSHIICTVCFYDCLQILVQRTPTLRAGGCFGRKISRTGSVKCGEGQLVT